jgi:hypothetical protein
MPSLPQDPTHRRPDLTIAKTVLPGWQAEIPYEEGVNRTLEWFRAELANGVEHLQAPAPFFGAKAELGVRRPSHTPADRDRMDTVQQSGRQVRSL